MSTLLLLNLWRFFLVPDDCTLSFTVSSRSDQVYQTPSDIYSVQGESAKIECSHSIDIYDRILWYKKSNRQLQFLGYMFYENGNPEMGLNVKIGGSATKDRTCRLTLEALRLNSSAEYYCAASRNALRITAPQHQNLTTFVGFFSYFCTTAHSLSAGVGIS